jgi:hypothetical protein
MADLIETLPAPPDGPIETWPLDALLTENARMGLIQNLRVISQPLRLKEKADDVLTADDLKLQRLVSERGLEADKLLARVQEADLRRKQYDIKWPELMARVEAAKRGKLIEGSAVPVPAAD